MVLVTGSVGSAVASAVPCSLRFLFAGYGLSFIGVVMRFLIAAMRCSVLSFQFRSIASKAIKFHYTSLSAAFISF